MPVTPTALVERSRRGLPPRRLRWLLAVAAAAVFAVASNLGPTRSDAFDACSAASGLPTYTRVAAASPWGHVDPPAGDLRVAVDSSAVVVLLCDLGGTLEVGDVMETTIALPDGSEVAARHVERAGAGEQAYWFLYFPASANAPDATVVDGLAGTTRGKIGAADDSATRECPPGGSDLAVVACGIVTVLAWTPQLPAAGDVVDFVDISLDDGSDGQPIPFIYDRTEIAAGRATIVFATIVPESGSIRLTLNGVYDRQMQPWAGWSSWVVDLRVSP